MRTYTRHKLTLAEAERILWHVLDHLEAERIAFNFALSMQDAKETVRWSISQIQNEQSL